MSREEQFVNFPKPHIINLLCDMTDLHDELEAQLEVAEWRAKTLEKIVSESMDSEHSYTAWIRENASITPEKIKAK